jgi:hypothetical protein
MNKNKNAGILKNINPVFIILFFSTLLFVLTGWGIFFDLSSGIGYFFIYLISYFFSLIIILPVLLIKRFGTGLLIVLPYSIIGAFIDYYMEWVKNPLLKNPFGAVGWSIFALFIGLSADLGYKFLPEFPNKFWRPVVIGIIIGFINFILSTVALKYFYLSEDLFFNKFAGIAYWALPWLLVNSAFGGYTAYTIAEKY